MVFSSITFLFAFLPAVLGIYFLLPRCARNTFLLLASLFFYAWGETFYVLVMLLSITGNWIFALWIDRLPKGPSRRGPTALGVIFNLALLISYKYANFLTDNLNIVLGWIGTSHLVLPPIHLPIGISFFTFQGISYVVDVHRNHVAAQRRWDKLALYKAFFPQLIAGPVVRYVDIALEIDQRRITLEGFASGVRLFIVGLAKKVLVANVVAAPCTDIFDLPGHELTAPLAWFGVLLYMWQLYFDFAGYSDMAIGMGRMFGFHFLPNFNYPYIAKTLTEFWQRWHISLSTWFRDYLFVPLGGYRVGQTRAYLNLLTVFLLCGIWHGASWNFVAFGLLHSLFLIVERIIRAKHLAFFKSPAGHVYFYFILGMSLCFFRANDLHQAGAFFYAMFTGGHVTAGLYPFGRFWTPELGVALACGAVASTPFLAKQLRRLEPTPLQPVIAWMSPLVLLGLFALCAMKLAAGTHNPFIYFRF